MSKAKKACIHHWVLESPNGSVSKGVCKKCGSERDYFNAPEYMREAGNQWMRRSIATWVVTQEEKEDRDERLVAASAETI